MLSENGKLSEIEENIEESSDDENEEDKIERFHELIGTAFNDLASSDSDSGKDITDHNIPDLPIEKSATVVEPATTSTSMIQNFQCSFLDKQNEIAKLEKIRLDNEAKLQQLNDIINEKDKKIELLENENEILKKQECNSKELFKRINELENHKIDVIKQFEVKKSNLESDMNKWKTLWLEEKNENDKRKVAFENKIKENQQLRCEIEKLTSKPTGQQSKHVQVNLENSSNNVITERKSMATSTTFFNTKVLKEIQNLSKSNILDPDETTRKSLAPCTISEGTSTLPWNELLNHITEQISDQCEDVVYNDCARHINNLQTELRKSKDDLSRMGEEMAFFLNRYYSFLVKVDTIFS